MQNIELRPLGAGEILDHAVTLFVRRFVSIVVVLAIAVVPLLVIEAFLAPGSTRMFADFGRLIAASGRSADTAAAMDALSRDQVGMGQYTLIMLLSLAVRPLMWSAILAVASAAYAGSTISLATAYQVGLRCWFPQVLVAIAFTIIASILFVPIVIAYAIAVAGVIGLVALHAGVVAAIFGVVAAIVVVCAFVAVGSWVFMTFGLASAAIVTEAMGPVAAISTGLRRALGRETWWRTLLAGLILLAVTQGTGLVFSGVGLALGALTHAAPLSFAFIGVGTVIAEGLLAVFVIVFATDVRVRREGLDLVALTESSAPA